MYLLNEDAPPLGGLIVCANSFSRSPHTGGLGTSGKKDIIEISLSFVQQGKTAATVDPMKDFVLSLRKEYAPTVQSGKVCLDRPFTVHPETQSRGTLMFHVDQDDTERYPRLIFHVENRTLVFCCDPELGKLLEQSANGSLDLERSINLSQFLVENERMDLAEKIVTFHLERNPGHPLLSLQKVAILRWFGRHSQANELLGQLADNTALPKEDAVSLAHTAFEQGQLDVVRKLLEPLGEKAQLEDRELLLLARCWYFGRAYEASENLLKQLADRGMSDRVLFFTLGNIADKRDDWPNAIKWWEKSLEIDPNHIEARFNVGVAHYKMGNTAEAKTAWTKVLGMNPDEETRRMTESALGNLK
jgi:tetratricopeptide (TPR) repeat protein